MPNQDNVMQAKDLIPDEGDVFVLCGDTPLITSDTLKKFAAYHSEKKNADNNAFDVSVDDDGTVSIISGDN